MNVSCSCRSGALPRRQGGAVAALIVIALAAIMLMAALALDGSHMLLNKTRLQGAVDTAGLQQGMGLGGGQGQ